MFNFLKNKETLLKEKLLKLQFKSNYQLDNSNKKIISIAILTTNEVSQKFNLDKLIEKHFQIKAPKIYSFRKFDKQNELSEIHFSEKEINKKGKITNNDFNLFLEEEYDLLIGFFDEENIFLEYTTAISKSKYKTGFAGVNSNLFDLEISTNVENSEEFLLELKKYLVILNKLTLDENLTVKAIL